MKQSKLGRILNKLMGVRLEGPRFVRLSEEGFKDTGATTAAGYKIFRKQRIEVFYDAEKDMVIGGYRQVLK